MARSRTTKGLAKRIALDYFKRPHPFRSLKSVLSWGAAIAGAILVMAVIVGAARRVVIPGPVSEPHTLFESECSRCHGGSDSGRFLARVSDGKCSTCHDGAVHHETQLFNPVCANCHAEHRGRFLA